MNPSIAPPASGPRPDYESRLRRSNRLGGTVLETEWSRAGVVTGRFARTVADYGRARSIRAGSSSVRRLRAINQSAPLDRRDRRRAATSSHAGASPARSSHARKVFAAACLTASQRDRVRLPVRAPPKRTAVRAARTLPSKQESRVRLPGGTPFQGSFKAEAPAC